MDDVNRDAKEGAPMTLQEKLVLALSDLVSAELKEIEGAHASASTHRHRAFVLLHSLCPTYQPGSEEGREVLACAVQEMRDLGALDRLWETADEDGRCEGRRLSDETVLRHSGKPHDGLAAGQVRQV